MKQDKTYRVAQAKDIEQIFAVRNAVKENVLSNPESILPTDCEAYLFDRGRGWVCEINNRVVGFSIVDLQENNVWALFVDPAYEKMGIGKQLHVLMLDWYFSQKKAVLYLTTEANTRAVVFYKKNAWEFMGDAGNGEIRFEIDFKTWEAYKSKFL